MLREIDTDEILSLSMMFLGGECSYIGNGSRWMNYRYKNLIFSAFSTRFPFDDPRRICQMDNKLYSRAILSEAKVPLIPWKTIKNDKFDDLAEASENRWVIKPIIGSKGDSVVTNVSTQEVVEILDGYAPGISILEPYYEGVVMRILILENKIIGAYAKHPPRVVGDGSTSLGNLVRSYKEQVQSQFSNSIMVDIDIQKTIQASGMHDAHIPQCDEEIVISHVNNICRGSAWENIECDVLDSEIVQISVAAAKATGLNLVGIDLIIGDRGTVVLEANPSPGLFGHTVKHDHSGRIRSFDFTVAQEILKSVITYLSPSVVFDTEVTSCLSYSDYVAMHT